MGRVGADVLPSVSAPRYVVCLAGTLGPELPPTSDLACQSGGGRTMHELSVAIAATGRDVEVRGSFDLPELRRMGAAAGAMPRICTGAREANADDVLLLPEGMLPVSYLPVVLGPARAIMLVLAVPGLFGWSFRGGWSPPDPTTVPLEAFDVPGSLRAMASLGFELWTHMPNLAAVAADAGLRCTWIGNGCPVPYPDPPAKDVDAAMIAANRWAPGARWVLDQLDPAVTRCVIDATDHDILLAELGRARVLILPSRVEGHSRIGQEARALGTVPVVLDLSPFAVGFAADHGAVAVNRLEAMPEAARALLADPSRLTALRERGVETARRQVDWPAYLARVDAALAALPPADPARDARALFGRELAASEQQAEARASQAELRASEAEARASQAELRAAQAEAARTEAQAAHHDVEARLSGVLNTRAWRTSVRLWRWRDRLRRAYSGR